MASSAQVSEQVQQTPLWRRFSDRPDYVGELMSIRAVAAILGEKISEALPEYTDHSLRHMDALWQVASQVLTADEVSRFTVGEAFLLGAAFYLHDLGMSIPITAQGKDQVRATEAYKAEFARLTGRAIDQERADVLAIRAATRDLHARIGADYITAPLPGLNVFLIEHFEFRERWAYDISQIAESHHWSLEQIEKRMGKPQSVPGPDGDSLDLGYVASILRIVDYAHINRERASMLDRALRSEMPHDSALHWDAQAKITGPWRDGNLLVFSCTSPLENVESWWLFYELASGLDSEIRSVYDYLRNRTASAGRFSLQGVKGVESPTSFNNYVRLAQNITPIDIRVQPDSMERVVQLLGGQQLYGADRLAPVRELIQNARDAIELRNAMESADGYPPTAGQITVSLEGVGSSRVLVVRDNGVGMSKKVILKHLIGVASDFWNSVEFYQSFRRALETGFRPIGKFGIGFLSVFMLGEEVHVETESIGSSGRFDLKLHGVGRRGELKERTATGQIGTEVRIVLKKGASDMMQDLAAVVRARAPMLRVPISVSTSIDANHKNESIAPRWWMRSTPG